MPYDLPDGTPSFKSYVNSKNNRFLNPDMASKNRLQPPCKVLHFYNTPPGLTEEDLRKVFEENGTAFPAEVRLLQNKSACWIYCCIFLSSFICLIIRFCFFFNQGEKSSSGHLEFSTLQEAVEALVICNHIPLSGASTSSLITNHRIDPIFWYFKVIYVFYSIISRCQVAVYDEIVFLDTPSGPSRADAVMHAEREWWNVNHDID